MEVHKDEYTMNHQLEGCRLITSNKCFSGLTNIMTLDTRIILVIGGTQRSKNFKILLSTKPYGEELGNIKKTSKN